MTSEALRAWAKRTAHDLIHGEEVEVHEAEGDLESAGRRVLRARVALAIVALSIFAAVAGWRASVFDERSSSANAMFHQDVVVQQQLEANHEATVARDITQYSELEQHWFMAARLQRDAGAPGAASSTLQSAGSERVAAEESLANFEAQAPQLYTNGTASYDPATAYTHDVAGDTRLGGLHPAAALRRSNSESDQAVNMTGVAALFVAALVLFTLAQVTLGRRIRPRGRETAGRWSISHTFVLAGTLLTATAAVLFTLVMLG